MLFICVVLFYCDYFLQKLNRVFIAYYRIYETLTFVVPELFFYTVFFKGLPMLAQKMLC